MLRSSNTPPAALQGNVPFLTFISLVSTLGGLLFGFNTVVLSGTLTPLKAQFALSPALEGWLVSSACWPVQWARPLREAGGSGRQRQFGGDARQLAAACRKQAEGQQAQVGQLRFGRAGQEGA
jgi:hypothetical protein